MENASKSTTENPKSKRFSVSSLSSNSEDEVDKGDIKEKQKKKKGLAEKFHGLKSKPRRKQEKHKESDAAMGSISDMESQQKPPKRHIGVIARIKRFGSRDELDNTNEDKTIPKVKEKKKSIDDDSDAGKHLNKEESKTSLLEKLRRFSEDSSSDEEDFALEVLSAANKYRRNHGLRRLRASKELQILAHEWARKLAKEQNVLERYSNKYGKNTFSKELSHPDEKLKPEEVVDEWYQEIHHYTFGDNPQDFDVTKNATQLLWKSSKEVGIARCRARDKNIIFVAAYFNPRGNIDGQYKDQVPPLGGFESRRGRSHSISESSSSDEEAKLKEKQDIIYGKSTKKNFLSHVFDKFRKNNDGDADSKKKEKKEHHGFIGHRSGKYFINTNKDQPLKEKEKEKEKEEVEKTKDQTKSNFYVVTTKEVEEVKRNLRKQDSSLENDTVVFNSMDLDSNKNKAVNMALAQRENSKISSSSSDEDVVDADKNRVNKEEKVYHSSNDEGPSLLTKISQEISDGEAKGQLKSSETDTFLSKIEIQDQRKNSSSSSSSDDENHIKNSTSGESKSKTSQILSDIKFELNSNEVRKHSSHSSSDDEKEKVDIETKVSNDMSQKTGFFSQMKVKVLQSVDKSSSDEEKTSSEFLANKDKKEDLKTGSKDIKPQQILSPKNVSSSSDNSSDEEERNSKTHIPLNSQSLTKISRIESYETTERKMSHSSSNESIHIKHESSDNSTKVESHASEAKEKKHTFEKRLLSNKLSSSSDEGNVNHKSTIFISPQFRHQTEISLPPRQNNSSINDDSSSSDDESQHKQHMESTNDDKNQKDSNVFEKLKNKFKKNTPSISSDDENDKCSPRKSDVPKIQADISNSVVSSNDSAKKIIYKSSLDRSERRSESSSDEENYIKQKQPHEFPDQSRLIFSSSMLPKKNHSSSSSDDENGKKSLDKKDSNIIQLNNDGPKHSVFKLEKHSELEDDSKFVLGENRDDKNNIFSNLKDKLAKNYERNSSSSDESEAETKKVAKEIPLSSNITSSINYAHIHKNETSKHTEINYKEINVRQFSSDEEKEGNDFTLEKTKEINIQLQSTVHDAEKDNSSSDEDCHHHENYDKISPILESKNVGEISHKSSMLAGLKTKIKSKIEDDSSSSDEENKISKVTEHMRTESVASEYKLHETNVTKEIDISVHTKRASVSSTDDEETCKSKINPSSNETKSIGLIHTVKDYFSKSIKDETNSNDEEENENDIKADINKTLELKKNDMSDKLQRSDSSSSDEDKKVLSDNKISSAENVKNISEASHPTDLSKKRTLYSQMKSFMAMKSDESSSSDDETEIVVVKQSSVDIMQESKVTDISKTEGKNDDTTPPSHPNLKTSPKGILKNLKEKFIKNDEDNSSSSDEDPKDNTTIEIIKEAPLNFEIKSSKDNIFLHQIETSSDSEIKDKKIRNIKGKVLKSDEDGGSSSDDDDKKENTSKIIRTGSLEFEIRSSKDDNLLQHNIETSTDYGIKDNKLSTLKGKLLNSDEDSSSSNDDDDKTDNTIKIIKEGSLEFEIKSSKDHHQNENLRDFETKDKISKRLYANLNDSSSSSSDEEQTVTRPYSKKSERDSYVETIKHVFENLGSKTFIKAGACGKIEEAVFDPEKCINLELFQRMLITINKYRLNHNAGMLVINKQMCNFAMERASSYACGTVGNLHSNFGENIFMYPSSGYSVKETTDLAIEAWYKTIIFHKFDVEPDEFDSKAGSFTQLVWKSSKEIGIGIHESDRENRIFIVAVFSPAGNVKDQYSYQVTPRISSHSNSPSPELGPSSNDRLI